MTDKFTRPARRCALTRRIHVRLAMHLKLDRVIWDTLRAYLWHHADDALYWERRCKPCLKLLNDHYRLTQYTSRPLKHYSQHVKKLVGSYPRHHPQKHRAMIFLALVETWYWREYP